MKHISSFYLSCTIVALICCGCPVKRNLSMAFATETDIKPENIERYYFIKGMNCGGCIFGVKNALKKAGLNKNQILEVDYSTPDPANKIGHAKVKFTYEQYKGKDTDCKIARQIRDDLGYQMYWDKLNTDPCQLENK